MRDELFAAYDKYGQELEDYMSERREKTPVYNIAGSYKTWLTRRHKQMLKFVNEKTGKTVITEEDTGEVEFHIKEDKEKELKEDKKKDKKKEE